MVLRHRLDADSKSLGDEDGAVDQPLSMRLVDTRSFVRGVTSACCRTDRGNPVPAPAVDAYRLCGHNLRLYRLARKNECATNHLTGTSHNPS